MAKKNIKSKKQNNNTKNSITSNALYKNAEKLYKNKNYEEAYEEYIKLANTYKSDKRIYKRLLETLTHDYTFKDKSKSFKKAYNDYLISYKILATKREQTILDKKLEQYKLVKQEKSRFLLIAFFGIFGIHKFIEKKYVLGIVYLLTLGLFGIGIIVDLINDYATYEDDLQFDIFRYFISIVLIIVAILNISKSNFYYLIIASILFTPFVFSKLLHFIPKSIKIIFIIILCIIGFKKVTVIESVPTNFLGLWKTNNEYTNFVSINIKNNKTTIKFSDRDNETGINEYNNETKILKVYVNETTYYRFKLDDTGKKLCKYNETDSCMISFEK